MKRKTATHLCAQCAVRSCQVREHCPVLKKKGKVCPLKDSFLRHSERTETKSAAKVTRADLIANAIQGCPTPELAGKWLAYLNGLKVKL